jgi:poly(3-hydroxybutyrate) depolymerase
VGFIAALIDHLQETYAIDSVYLTGFGHGGSMAYRLACEIPGRLAKVAVVGALPWDYQTAGCGESSAPVSILMLNGSEDDYYYPVIGDRKLTRNSANSLLSVEEALTFWAAHNGCDLDAALTDPADQAFTVYESCADNSTVAAYTLPEVGHNWLRAGDYHLNQYGVSTTDYVGRYFFDDFDSWANLFVQPEPAWTIYFGQPRSYIVYVPPSYDPAQPAPLVVALHGRPHNGAGFAYLLDLNRVAADNGFIAVYPDGFQEEWNYVRDITPGYEDWGVDDVEFLSFLIDDLSQDLNIDRTRLYATGFSNGGFMTQRLACEPDTPFAAFGVFGATLYPEFEELCSSAPLRPILLMHGTFDRSIPWEGTVYGDVVVASRCRIP